MEASEYRSHCGGKALVGWKAIADFLGWTLSKTMKYSQELRARGVVFKTLKGKPPNRRKVVFTFPIMLISWLSEPGGPFRGK